MLGLNPRFDGIMQKHTYYFDERAMLRINPTKMYAKFQKRDHMHFNSSGAIIATLSQTLCCRGMGLHRIGCTFRGGTGHLKVAIEIAIERHATGASCAGGDSGVERRGGAQGVARFSISHPSKRRC